DLELWRAALDGVAQYERLEGLYRPHLLRRDLVMQSPASDGKVRGAISRRSPVRPIPIAASIVALVRVGSDGLMRSESNLRHRLSGRGIGRASSDRIALLLLHQLDEPAELLVDLPELKGGEFGRVGDAAVRALRLLVPDQRHEVRAKESIVARAYDVA